MCCVCVAGSGISCNGHISPKSHVVYHCHVCWKGAVGGGGGEGGDHGFFSLASAMLAHVGQG